MGVNTRDFFCHMDSYVDYRQTVYEASAQTLKSNQTDLNLFKMFLEDNQHKTVTGPTVMAFQHYLKNDRLNCGNSINRKIFTLRSYSHFLKLQDVPEADTLPFYDVLKIRRGYRNRPGALTSSQIIELFTSIDRTTCLGIRDYAVYALMYLGGLRVGEVFDLGLDSIDSEKKTMEILGKGRKYRTLHLQDELFHILCEYLSVRSFLFKSHEQDALFVSKKGNRLAIRTMEDNFKKLVHLSGITARFNITCHTLRHSFASHLNDKEVDMLVVNGHL